jgi:hypothetical protein
LHRHGGAMVQCVAIRQSTLRRAMLATLWRDKEPQSLRLVRLESGSMFPKVQQDISG